MGCVSASSSSSSCFSCGLRSVLWCTKCRHKCGREWLINNPHTNTQRDTEIEGQRGENTRGADVPTSNALRNRKASKRESKQSPRYAAAACSASFTEMLMLYSRAHRQHHRRKPANEVTRQSNSFRTPSFRPTSTPSASSPPHPSQAPRS